MQKRQRLNYKQNTEIIQLLTFLTKYVPNCKIELTVKWSEKGLYT